ncbi:hypothetical protein NIES4101_53260 [Calothrix sp. NIES-4101]|nr:hypothetical protein NIES4101_53260 [Calothrix sp. NIES-4101]
MKEAFPEKFEIKGKQEKELTLEITKIIASSQGIAFDEKMIEAMITSSKKLPQSRLTLCISTAYKILDKVEEILNADSTLE